MEALDARNPILEGGWSVTFKHYAWHGRRQPLEHSKFVALNINL